MSYECAVRLIGDFAQGGRRTVWTFQGYGFIVYLRYKRHASARCGHPQFYLANRYSLHRIGGEPGKVRARLRQKTAALWIKHLAFIKKIAIGQVLRRIEAANDKHKGTHSTGTGGAPSWGRSPPPKNRPAWRRFKGVASNIEFSYGGIKDRPSILLHGWLVRRLSEWHHRDRILACLRHAVRVMPRHPLPFNPPAWVSAVAAYHLDSDGLSRSQRRDALRAEDRKTRRFAPDIQEEKFEIGFEIIHDEE